MLIRTAGEMRISNYLLWQISYSELWVTDCYWPDFRESNLHEALERISPPETVGSEGFRRRQKVHPQPVLKRSRK